MMKSNKLAMEMREEFEYNLKCRIIDYIFSIINLKDVVDFNIGNGCFYFHFKDGNTHTLAIKNYEEV